MILLELNFQEDTGIYTESAGCWTNGSQKLTESFLHSHVCPVSPYTFVVQSPGYCSLPD